MSTMPVRRILLSCAAALIVSTIAAPAVRAQSLAVSEQKVTAPTLGVLASVKNLYASASYEAALSELDGMAPSDDSNQLDVYRALCLLALDRQHDAEQVLGEVVTRAPLFAMSDAEFSPRVITMFHDVRKRMLPAAAQQVYTSAKGDYERKDYGPAVSKFKQLFLVLDDADTVDPTGRLADLRELADGFLKLSQQRLADATPSAAPAAAPPAAAPAPVVARLYTLEDPGIRPPQVISQVMPQWRVTGDSSRFMQTRAYTGRLEMVINEQGTVDRVVIAKSIWPPYDAQLIEAAKTWRYQPAQINGKPVRYFKALEINVNAANGGRP